EDFEMEETVEVIVTENTETASFENDLLKFKINYDKAWETYPKKEYFFHINTVDGLVDMFQQSLKVDVAGEGSNIINLAMEGPIVDLQKMFINQLLESYKAKELYEMKTLGNKTVLFLDSLIRELTGEIDVTRNKLQSGSTQGIDAGQTDIALRNALTELETSYGQMEAQLRYYRGIAQKLENSRAEDALELPTSSIGTSDPNLTALINNLSELQKERAFMMVTNTRGPNWEVNLINIQNTRTSIKANVQSSTDGLEGLMDSKLRQINEIRGRLSMLPKQKTISDDLMGTKINQQDQLEVLKARKTESALAVQNAKVDIEIIENARMDGTSPIKPKKPLILLISVFMGLVLPLALIIGRDFFDNRIASHEDIQSSTNLPVLGFVARHDRNSNYIVPKDSRTALAESFRSIRIKMQYLNDNVHQQVIGVTSSSSGEGKTFCVTNIAAVMAQAGKKTLLVDMDLRRPRVTRYFDNPEGLGLSNYLAGEGDDPMSIVAETHIENLYVIHSGPVATNPLDLISTDRMTHLMEKYREEFDHIVLDAPPLGLVSDYLVILKLTDFNIYVVRDSSTTIDSLKMINELYDSQKIKNIAMLINDVKSVAAYGYIDKHYGYGD
ncbi:MAG: polysaccharide biosynthesis tyrosine autokinase, partial [Bacteroidia bacterium]|nr:polysaccharide biosynthesis tyrosine autokinase [Bacteroidia bacterium]